ncbi:hypothetical protein [Leekyejoonella antrihumi]|uniref:Cytochrome b561 bacterial/Ni-hydrogenase domain-containing protein n=1 Tax=Leekyejoonella antrihumi TaxID=1660198 RepID=A0A563DV98_9MICO|nr:hypothetical protein [Leekyejoonella antrihumi]TWP33842.1 hypothetical protein FGL98_19885 [Leekyejoonella antrihumi]
MSRDTGGYDADGRPDPRAARAQVAIEEITGRATRRDPILPRTGGPAGNARLTAWTGLVLLVLLAVEGATLLDMHGLINWHIIVGLLLIPPALLKVGTTGWRIARYYTGDTAYRQAGAPQAVLRVLGPLVVLFTLLLLATGLLLTIDGPAQRDSSVLGLPFGAMFLHQASFFAWLVVMTVHVLARTMNAAKIVSGRAVSRAAVAGRGTRGAVLLAMAGSSVVLAVLLAGPWISRWSQTGFHFRH